MLSSLEGRTDVRERGRGDGGWTGCRGGQAGTGCIRRGTNPTVLLAGGLR